MARCAARTTDDDALYRSRKAAGRFSPFGELPDGTDPRIANGLNIIHDAINDAREHPPAANDLAPPDKLCGRR